MDKLEQLPEVTNIIFSQNSIYTAFIVKSQNIFIKDQTNRCIQKIYHESSIEYFDFSPSGDEFLFFSKNQVHAQSLKNVEHFIQDWKCQITESQLGLTHAIFIYPQYILTASDNNILLTLYDIKSDQKYYIRNPKSPKTGIICINDLFYVLESNGQKDQLSVYKTDPLECRNKILLETIDATQMYQYQGLVIVIDGLVEYKLLICNESGILIKFSNNFLGINLLKCSKNMVALGGGDGIRVLNGINWQQITVFDGKGEQVRCFKDQDFQGIKKKQKILQKGEPILKQIEWSYEEDYVIFFNKIACKWESIQNSVYIFEIISQKLVAVVQMDDKIKDFKWADQSLYICNGTSQILLWKKDNNVESYFISKDIQQCKINKIFLSPDNSNLYFKDKNNFYKKLIDKNKDLNILEEIYEIQN